MTIYSVSQAFQMMQTADNSDRREVILGLVRDGLFDGPIAKRSLGSIPDLCEMHGVKLSDILRLASIDESERIRELSDDKLTRSLLDVVTSCEREEMRLEVYLGAAKKALQKAREPVTGESDLLVKYYDLQYAIAQTKAELAGDGLSDELRALFECELSRANRVLDKIGSQEIARAAVEHEKHKPTINTARIAYLEIDERHSVLLLFSAVLQHVLMTLDARPTLELAEARTARESRAKRGVDVRAVAIPSEMLAALKK